MARISESTRRIIVKEGRRRPYLGCRKLAQYLKEKYGFAVSKTTVHSYLNSAGIKNKPGRRKSISIYQKKYFSHAGALILEAAAQRIKLFSSLSRRLAVYFPQFLPSKIEKYLRIIFYSCALKLKIEGKSRLLLLRLRREGITRGEFFSFYRRLAEQNPLIDRNFLSDNLKLTSGIRIVFSNGAVSYVDACFNTFWRYGCHNELFYDFYPAVLAKLKNMVSLGVLSILATHSFNFLSPAAFQFIKNITAGIKEIQVVFGHSILETIFFNKLWRPAFYLGYYPKRIARGILTFSKAHFYKINTHLTHYFISQPKAVITQQKIEEEVIAVNSLVKERKGSLPFWGVITNRQEKKRNQACRNYFWFYPYPQESFFRQMDVLERKINYNFKKDYLLLLPKYIRVSRQEDFFSFVKLAQEIILYSFFYGEHKELLSRFLAQEAEITASKEAVYLRFKQDFEPFLGVSFNDKLLYLGRRRLFIQLPE